jgi:diacylglycerol kinase family enzyme
MPHADAAPVAPSLAPSAAPRLRTVAAVVNRASHSVRAGAERQLEALIAEHGYRSRLFVIGEGGPRPAVDEALATAPDLLVVLAGDGTARLAAERCGPHGPLVAPLPGGTMNMLPHAVYGAAPWQDALKAALERGVERVVGGGRVDGRAFFVAAVLGSPALWGDAREALRAGHLAEAWRRAGLATRRALAGRVAYAANGAPERRGKALALICPIVSKVLQEESRLELAAFDFSHPGEIVRLALSGFTGEWRDDPAVTTELAQRGWARMRGSLPAMLDGERERLGRFVTFEFVPRAFRALAPPAAALASR